MEATKNYFNWTMDDIVFDNRNKDYGAYQLRLLSKRNVIIGLLIAVFAFSAFIGASMVDWGFLIPENKNKINKKHENNKNIYKRPE